MLGEFLGMWHMSSISLLMILSNFLMLGLEKETAYMRMQCMV